MCFRRPRPRRSGTTYGGFWLALGIFVILLETTKLGSGLHGPDVPNALAWFLVAFAIFNFYMLLWSSRIMPILSKLGSPMPRRTEV